MSNLLLNSYLMNDSDIDKKTFRQSAIRWIKWWLILGIVSGLVTPVVSPYQDFWSIKLKQVESGIALAIAGYFLFLITQYAINRKNKNWILWANAFLSWFVVRVIWLTITT